MSTVWRADAGVVSVKMTFRGSYCTALEEEMTRDKAVLVLGEDVEQAAESSRLRKVCSKPSVHHASLTRRLQRIRWQASHSVWHWAVQAGLEIMFSDFLTCAMDQIGNEIAKMRYVTGGEYCVPLVIRNACGAAIGWAEYHFQCLESIFMNIPGGRIMVPSTPNDAYGSENGNPRQQPSDLLRTQKAEYPRWRSRGRTIFPIGKARVLRVEDDDYRGQRI